MEKVSRFIRSIVVAFAFVAFTPAASAAGTFVVDQINPLERYAEWRLTTPSGTVVNRNKEQNMSVNAEQGLFVLRATPPEGAIMTMKFYNQEGGLLQTVQGTEVAFVFPGTGYLRAVLEMRYEGVITVESEPSGAPFELTGPNGLRYTNVTPATFKDFPPLYYSITWGNVANCPQRPRSQHRTLRPNQTISFVGDYVCDNEVVTGGSARSAESSISSSSSTASSDEPLNNVRLWHTAHQTETVAGGAVRVTIGVRNLSRTTLRNIEVTEEFDPTALVLERLPKGGVLAQGSKAVWKIPEIYAGQSWTVTLPVRVDERLSEGEKLELTARIAGDDLRTVHGDLLSSSLMIGVASMPATGGNFDLLFALLSAVGVLTLTLKTRRYQEVELTV